MFTDIIKVSKVFIS